MEPDGQPLTPATSNGPLSYASAPNPIAPSFLNCSLESSCSPNLSDVLMTAGRTWDLDGEDDPEQTAAERQRKAQRIFKSSAFPSSLRWDSDSEKETLDEEEVQSFSNPHGLATHSPGSPSAGLRFDGEDDQELEKRHSFNSTTDTSTPAEGCSVNNESTNKEEPNTRQLGQTESADKRLCSVSEGAEPFLSKGKPKEACLKEEEADSSEEEIRPKGNEAREPERDVYTFPGDSDPESPPPAPWAHCTFIQRCRRKRALLRPFSGIGSPKTHKLDSLNPPTSKTEEAAPLSRAAEVYEFEEVSFDDGETIKFREKPGREVEEVEESGFGAGSEIFTCVECSIYFRKQVHLQEHMTEHCQTSPGGGRHSGKGSRLRCDECGWNLPSRPALADHRRRHQESRLKILEEIEKLNENEKAKESEAVEKDACADPTVTQPLNAGEMSDGEIGKSPPPSTASFSLQETDPAVIDVDSLPPNSHSVRSPAQAHRRHFVCTECSFSTRTSQALANHSKIHKRKKQILQPHPRRKVLRERQTLVHQEKLSTKQDSEASLPLTSNAQILKQARDCHDNSECESPPSAASVKSQGDSAASEDRATSDRGAAQPKSVANRRFKTAGKPCTDQPKFDQDAEDVTLPGSEAEEREFDLSGEPKPSQQEASSTAGRKLHNTEVSSPQHEDASPLPAKKAAKHQDEQKERKVFFLRRSSRVMAPPAQPDSDDEDDDSDEEHMPCFLSEGVFEKDPDEIDDPEALRSVERKCPYCPDRFYNGIGLANHVRGHLKRVGVSYNVRHFISPEEVNAIEKKFSYQKKKKKVANFDPDTFSLMHCEFCSAGFDTRAGLSSHARAHLRDFGITNWDVTISPIHILRELFSSRPDLVIPTDPPRSLGSSSEEDEDEDCDNRDSKDGGIIRVKLEEEISEKTARPSDCATLSPGYRQRREEERAKDCEGNDKEAADEEDEEGVRLSALDGLCSVSGKKNSLSLRQDVDANVKKWKCEVCDSQFESRRGLSIHSRAHLRQLGFTVSESGGSAIELLHRVAMERSIDGKISSSLLTPKKPCLRASLKDEEMEDVELDEKPIPLSILAKTAKRVPSGSDTPTPSPGASPAPVHSNSPSSVVKKAPISSLLPVSSPLRSQESKVGGIKCLTSNLSAASATTTSKPLWAPQENDAPLNLTLDMDSDKDIVCQLCGAWFETRKGLSSHARAHLRHFGVEYSESKGSPIELLSQLMDTDDFKYKASALELDGPTEVQDVAAKQSLLTLSSSSSASLLYKVTTVGGGSKATSSSSLPGPPAKRLKTSSMQVFRLSSGELMALPHNEPPKEIGCEYCGEYFENRKGLSSHARSHLRQMGITEWSVNGSPIDTLREIITRRGLPCALPLKPLKTPPPSSPGPPRSPLSTSSSPSATLLGRLPFAFARPSSPPQSPISKSSSAPQMSSSSLTLTPKPEPVQVEVTPPGSVGRSGGFPAESPSSSWRKSDKVYPLNLAMAHEVEPIRDIRCEFCGEYFENRKGLSSHARSHLRQMGITEWSVNGSPIDTLREVMHKRQSGGSSRSDQGVKRESRQGTNSPLWEDTGGAKGSEGFSVPGYHSSKFRKSPLSLIQSGSRILKQGLGSAGPSATHTAGKLFRLSPLGKQPLSDKAQSAEAGASHSHQLKTFPSLPHDFSYKRKPSPEKHGHQDPSCELCGFYFENRKALASHARAHLRQFGVTEWSVNGSPIETLSAWIRSRPQKVLEMHRNYMQGSRSSLKKKAHSSSSASSQWSSSLAASLARPQSQELCRDSSEIADEESSSTSRSTAARAGGSSPTFSRLGSSLQAQVARSELNVRLPRGFERRPLKHPSCPDGADRDSGSPKPPRTGTVPSLVPKPPSYPLVKLVGKFYTLKCRFCEVEFHGPLSVQEDWIRHLQQHIFKMNYNKPAALKATAADTHNLAGNSTPVQASDPSSRTASTPTRSTAPNSRSPTPVAVFAAAITAKEITQVSEEQPAIIPTPIPLPTQMV